MSTITRRAGGASAYSRSSYSAFQPLDERGVFGPDGQESPARGWSSVVDELLRIRTLKDDWDGEGTEAPHPALVDGAITLAQSLQAKGDPPPDRVHAGVNATVYFEWHTPDGYTEIEVVSPVEAECRSVRQGTNTTEVVYLSLQP
jgi:hypothetical protein